MYCLVMHLPALFTMQDDVLAEAISLLVTIVSNNSIEVQKNKETRHTQKVTEDTGRQTNKYYTRILAYASLVSIHRQWPCFWGWPRRDVREESVTSRSGTAVAARGGKRENIFPTILMKSRTPTSHLKFYFHFQLRSYTPSVVCFDSFILLHAVFGHRRCRAGIREEHSITRRNQFRKKA